MVQHVLPHRPRGSQPTNLDDPGLAWATGVATNILLFSGDAAILDGGPAFLQGPAAPPARMMILQPNPVKNKVKSLTLRPQV